MYHYLIRNGIDREILEEIKPMPFIERKVIKESYRSLEYKHKRIYK